MIQSEKIIDGYAKEYEEAIKTLQELLEASRSFTEALAAQRDARRRIKASQAKIESLQAEREALFSQHQRASFQGDTEKLEEIANERKELESKLEVEGSNIEEAELDIAANLIDSIAAAEFQLRLDEVKRIQPNDVIRDITQALYAEEKVLEEQRGEVSHAMRDIPINKKHYEEHDPVTQKRLKNEADTARAKKQAEEAKEQRRIEALLQVLRHSDDALEAYQRGKLAGAGPVDPEILARV
jgi:hypothetical protein